MESGATDGDVVELRRDVAGQIVFHLRQAAGMGVDGAHDRAAVEVALAWALATVGGLTGAADLPVDAMPGATGSPYRGGRAARVLDDAHHTALELVALYQAEGIPALRDLYEQVCGVVDRERGGG